MKMEGKTIYEQLIHPFSYEEVSWRVSGTYRKDTSSKKAIGIIVPYVTKVTIQDRLDEVFGFDGWHNEYQKWGDNAQLCGISFKVGSEFITKWDGSPNTQYQEIKGGLSDSFKRAAKMLGIGRYLSKVKPLHIEVDLKGGDNSTPTIRRSDLEDGAIANFYYKEVERIFNKTSDSKKAELPINNSSKQESFDNQFKADSPKKDKSMISKESLNTIHLLLKQKRVNVESVLNRYKINSLEELTASDAQQVIGILIKQNVSA